MSCRFTLNSPWGLFAIREGTILLRDSDGEWSLEIGSTTQWICLWKDEKIDKPKRHPAGSKWVSYTNQEQEYKKWKISWIYVTIPPVQFLIPVMMLISHILKMKKRSVILFLWIVRPQEGEYLVATWQRSKSWQYSGRGRKKGECREPMGARRVI